jgi:hypothetical protein
LTSWPVTEPRIRTTFTLDEDTAVLAQNYAKAGSLRPGKAVPEFIRRASAPPVGLKKKGNHWAAAAPPDRPTICSDKVQDMTKCLPVLTGCLT